MPLIVDSEFSSQLESAVREAATRADVSATVNRLYAELQMRIDERRPICVASGKCCHFERYGHRLYVSTMELAAFVAAIGAAEGDPAAAPRTSASSVEPRGAGGWDGTGCPFQIGKLCGVHSFRPFGCRVFFCDPTATQWQQDQYEQFHGELRKLHDRLGIPYFYVEWRAGLAAVGLTG
jgi:Fe-S-cluster containining protein